MKIIKKNKLKTDCGVVAAYNAASWCNSCRSYSEVERLAKSCGYNPNKGIFFFQFANLMKKMGLPAKRIKPKSRKEVESRLHSGKFLIFLYTPTGHANGHAITAFVNHRGKIVIVNPEGKRSTWFAFASDLSRNGVRNFIAYEIPQRVI